ncbi:hypothetical protein P4283_28900 [Bacillus thuringiensis]|nr:hypothetical protein [Bacillus thuringiensis]
MTKENEFNSYKILHGAALDSKSIEPTFPPTPTFTMPTNDIGPTGGHNRKIHTNTRGFLLENNTPNYYGHFEKTILPSPKPNTL